MTDKVFLNASTPDDEWHLLYFNRAEMRCRGSLTFLVPLEFANKVDMLRHRFGEPLYVNSWFRSPDYNKSVGGAKNSLHLKGRAVDISTVGYDAAKIAKLVDLALQEGLTGLGVYPRFIHLDDGPRRLWWGA